ncbi:hypothetical protein LCGC14_2166660 [marine sediment metagenome]|uniref:Uncharacterized protein n=1 Tax=marine sediment metagenome TaxID=412755 RepID=A0A0F9DRC4_9ZZZZ
MATTPTTERQIKKVVTSTAIDYTALITDDSIRITAQSVTVTLHAASAEDGKRISVSRRYAAGTLSSIAPDGGDTINGSAASINLVTNNTSFNLESDGVSDWGIV